MARCILTWYLRGPLKACRRGSVLRKRLITTNDAATSRRVSSSAIDMSSHPICFDEGAPLPDPDSPIYQPTATPGARLPHAWLEPGVSIHDRIGFGMTLLALDAEPSDVLAFQNAARDLRIPLDVVVLKDRPDLRSLYRARLLLLRPDLHVAWRGDLADAPERLLSVGTGHTKAA